MSNTPSKAEIEVLVKRHGATSYRNRSDTRHPAYGFTEVGLQGLIAEVRKQDDELIQQMLEALETCDESDGYTAIPWRKKPASECPDGPRYKALGNSWAVPNVRWVGQRIDAAVRRLR